ncbi:hypothetical protein ACSUZJ_14615 [Telluria sp. B2]
MMRSGAGHGRMQVIGSAMRHARKSLCSRIEQLATAPHDAFVAAWPTLVAEVEALFRHEEALMEAAGYGGLQAHLADNALALCALHRVTPQVEAGDTALGREALGALAAILSLHRFTADLALVGSGARGRRTASAPARFTRHAQQITVRPGPRRAPGNGPGR